MPMNPRPPKLERTGDSPRGTARLSAAVPSSRTYPASVPLADQGVPFRGGAPSIRGCFDSSRQRRSSLSMTEGGVSPRARESDERVEGSPQDSRFAPPFGGTTRDGATSAFGGDLSTHPALSLRNALGLIDSEGQLRSDSVQDSFELSAGLARDDKVFTVIAGGVSALVPCTADGETGRGFRR
jgi:hypothetical protein